MGKYSSFANLLKDQAMHDSLPSVLFTENADLRGATARLAMSTELPNEVSNESIADVVNEFDKLDSNRYEFGSMFTGFESISKAFADKINSGVEALRNIKSTVSNLKEKHDETVAMRIAEDPVLAKICGIQKDLNMDSVNWSYLDEIDERYLVTELHDKIGHDPDREITTSIIGLVINALPCANHTNKVEFEKIKLDANTLNTCVNKLSNFISNEDKNTVAGMFVNLLNLDQYACELAVKSARQFIDGKSAKDINKILHISVAYNKLFDAIKSVDLDLSASTMQELGKHVTAMHSICSTMLYIAMYYRNTIWKDAILVPGPYVNSDNLEKFEQDGGNVTNIVHHYNRFYTDANIPTRGISGKFVLMSAEKLAADFEKEATKSVATINTEKKRIERGTFIATSVEYLKNTKLSPKFAFNSNIDKYAASVYDSMPDQPVEASFYKLIINAVYPNSLTAMLYDRISKEYTNYASKTGKLSKEACEELDTKVYADLISEYLVDQGVLVIS